MFVLPRGDLVCFFTRRAVCELPRLESQRRRVGDDYPLLEILELYELLYPGVDDRLNIVSP